MLLFRLRSAISMGLACILASTIMAVCQSMGANAQAAPQLLLVTNTGDSGPGSLRQAILDANNGDTIGFALGPNPVITLTSGTLVITKSLVIDGAGAPNLKISGDDQYRVFRLTAPSTIASLTIANGFEGAGNGGGVNTTSAITLTDVSVVGNAAFNPSSGSGGGVWAGGDVVVEGGVFTQNLCRWSSCSGGAIHVNGKLSVRGSQFISNTASFGGGVAAIQTSILTGALFVDNHARSSGGGIYGYTVWLTDSKFISNTTSQYGAGAFAHDAATVNGGIFESNRCVAVVNGCAGGGLYAPGTLAVLGTQFLSNTAASGAGGAFVGYTATVKGALFLNNRCTDTNCFGGGISLASNIGELSIANTKFIGNEAWQGGGLAQLPFPLAYDFDRMLVNVLFARNIANSGTGAALQINQPGVIQLVHATIASPTMASGAAIYVAGGTLLVTNTVIVSHSVGIMQTAGSVSEDYNLFSGNGTDISGSVTSGTHHPLGVPAFTAPNTDDYHPMAGSAVIDNAANLGIADDLDGSPRPMGNAADIGAYEYNPLIHAVYLPLVTR